MSTFDAKVLDQAEVWVNGAGQTVALADMDVRYLANLRRFLDRHAGEIHGAFLWTATHPAFRDDLPHDIDVEIVHYDVSDAEFLARLPLYREIVRRLDEAEVTA